MRGNSQDSATITSGKVRLRGKRLADARQDYKWQTDPELVELDATEVLVTPYSQYLTEYAAALRFLPNHRCSFAIETLGGKHIGNCTCYDIDSYRGEAQIGIIIGDRECWGKGYGTDALDALIDHIFRESKLNRLYLKTLDWNVRAQRAFEKCGFVKTGRTNQDTHDFVVMELHRKRWEELKRQRSEAARDKQQAG